MLNKKLLSGALVLALVLGGTFAYSQGENLQGKFSTTKMTTSKNSTGSSTSTTKPDFSFHGAVSYDSSINAYQVKVCQTNVTSADVKQTSVQFSVSGGQDHTVQFTPTVTSSSEICQTVKSGDLFEDLLIQVDGAYDVTVTLDTTSVHTEASETNNRLSTSDIATESDYYLYDSNDLPDLTVEDMYFQVDSSDGRPMYNVISLVCGLDGLKEYPSGGEVASTYILSQDGVEIASDTKNNGNFFTASSDCTEYGFTLSTSEAQALSTGTVSLYTQLDVMESVPESNENNNGFGQTFTDEIVME